MPHVPQDLLDRVASLEREVRQLRGRAQIRPALNQVLNGDVTIGEGGRLLVQDPDGDAVFETGQSAAGDWYVTMRRDDGTPAIGIGANTYPGDDAVAQMVRVFNREGRPIIMDDYYADSYLGKPYVPVPMVSPMDFTSDTETALHSGYLLVQHKVLYVNGQITGPSGTSARMRLTVDGDEYGSWTLTSTATALEISERLPLAASDHPYGSGAVVVLWGQRTGGTGSVRLRVRGVWGMHTETEAEAT